MISFEQKYWIVKLKAYFDKGYSITHWFKYAILAFGWMSGDKKSTLYVGLTYMIGCFIIGYCWYKFGWVEAECEVGNNFNRFVKEMRSKFKKKNI